MSLSKSRYEAYVWSFGEPSLSAWLQFQNVSLVFLPRHEYTYVNTGMDMDSGTAVRIFVLDTPILSAHPEFDDASVLAGADCTLTALETDVWLSRISEEISADVTWVVILRNSCTFTVVAPHHHTHTPHTHSTHTHTTNDNL